MIIKRKPFLIMILLPCLLLNCASSGRWLYEIDQPENIYINNLLKNYLRENPSPKVVFRVPGPAKEVTEADLLRYNFLSNYLEELLLKNGFIVRDRSLLQQTLSGGANSYSDIGKKIDTSLIIEITKLNIREKISGQAYWIYEKNSKKVLYPESPIYGIVFECRIILVETNDLAGILRFTEPYSDCESKLVYNKITQEYYFVPDEAEVSLLINKLINRFVGLLIASK